MSRRATLFGREREQALLLHRLGEALGGQGGLVLIGGEAGIGKTALAAWLAAEARRAGARVFLGGCDDLTITPPFGPWIEAFAAFDVEHPLRPDALGGAEGSQQQLFAHVHAFLARMAGADGLLLVLDDLHWADPASVELLRAQARRVVTLPVLLVATYRLDDLPAGGPLSQALPVLVREGTTERIDLPALDTSAVRALVVDRYAPPPADAERLTAYLHQRSGGNPFFLSEVLRALEFERRLVPDSGGWRVGALDAILPPLVRQAIEGRLRRLHPDTLALLEVASVIGQAVPRDLWRALADADDDRLGMARREAADAHLTTEPASDERLAFVHALVRDTLYHRQPEARRRALHRRVAELLATTPDAPPSVVAGHYAQADDPRAVDWFIQAGQQALALFAARDAVDALSRAQDLALRHRRELPPGAFRARAAAHALLGEFEPARRDYETVLERSRAAGDARAEWQALADLGLHWAERDYERTGVCYQAALALARGLGDQALIAHSLNRIANWRLNRDEPEVALPLHREALTIFEALGDEAGVADTLDLLGMTSYVACDYVASMGYYERALAMFRAAADRQRIFGCLVAMQLLGGEQDAAVAAPLFREPGFWERCGAEALAIAREIGWTAGEAFALTMRSFASAVRGDYGSALADARIAVQLSERVGHQQWTSAAQCALGAVYIALYDFDAAAAALESALLAARLTGSGFWITAIAATLASARVAQGRLTHAEVLLDGIPQAGQPGASMGQRQAWCTRAELALARGEPERALACIDQLLASRPNAAADHGIPQLTKLRGDALARLGRLAEAEAEYHAARDGALLFGYRPLLWQADAALGALHLARGSHPEADAALAEARSTIDALAATLDAPTVRARFRDAALARLPSPVSRAGQGPAGLSPRELEVLRLLVEGRSDRAIAEALSISPRTVMRHVGSIFNKLGVSSRTAAATLATRRGIV